MTEIENQYYFKVAVEGPLRILSIRIYLRRQRPRWWQRQFVLVKTGFLYPEDLVNPRGRARQLLDMYAQENHTQYLEDRALGEFGHLTKVPPRSHFIYREDGK